jgi:arabinoxylan arabinofuranohydrolase
MKQMMKKSSEIIIGLVLLLSLFASIMNAAANPNPTWYVDARVILHRQLSPYDYYGAKDPTIVYYGGKYHVFYTGANQSGGWQMLYTSASTIAGLASAPRTYMSKIGESYFCAPEVFYFEPKGLWYLVYQDGTHGAAYATTTNIADPNSWSGPKSFGISGNMGWDYYIICDDTYAYMYNTPSDGSGKLYLRKTTLANFPTGWSAPTVAISNTFEGAEVYKSLADGKYYLLIEDMKDGRYYELWTSSSAGGPWTQVAEKWAWRGNLVYNADKWTTNVSHGELIRAGYNQKLEINDINRVDFLIQGTTNLSGDYQKIIWDLGVIRNYTGNPPTPTPTPGPRSAFSQIEAESYDTQSGIQTESCNEGGQNIGYVENGDYVVYNNIDFGSGATGFQARVASATSGGNIEIRLDSITGALVGTCPVAGTGDWQTWVTATCNVSGVSGTHNLYLSFTGGSGYLFNVNRFQFTGGSTPTPTPTPTLNNLISNPGMETGNTNGWAVNGAGSIAVSTAQKHSDTYSLLSTGRTSAWNGPIHNITSKVQSGTTYHCSGWVRLDNVASDAIIMTIKKVDGGGTTYTNIVTGTGSNSSWVQLSGSYTLTVTGTLNELSVYFEGPASGVNMYVDDVLVTTGDNATPTPPPANKFHCFLLLGQSNMAGYALAQAADKMEDPRVLVLGYDNNSTLGRVTDQWDVACPPLHAAWLDAIGPGDWFGKTVIQNVPAGDTIGLIPCAISGEKIETFMKVGGTKYSWIINRAKLAQQRGGVIEGILFHQGESNSGDTSWPGKVRTLVTDLRNDLNLGNVPFLAGELLYSGPCAGHNTLVNQLPSLITNCYVISANGLVQDPGDTTYHLHFSHDSSVEFGKRYAAKMIQVLGW